MVLCENDDIFNYDITFEKMKKKDDIIFLNKLNDYPQMISIEKFLKKINKNILIYYSYLNTKLVYLNHNYCISYTFYTNTNLIIKVSNLDPFKNDLIENDISIIDFYLTDMDNNEKLCFSLIFNPAISMELVTKVNSGVYLLPNYIDYISLVENNIIQVINPYIYLDYLMICDYTKIKNELNMSKSIDKLRKEKLEMEENYKIQIKKYDNEIEVLIKDKIHLFRENLVLDRYIMNRL